LSRISEFEPRQRDERRSARRSWPGSARFAMGTMVVLNLTLIAFLVKNEVLRPGPPEAPAVVKTSVPGVGPQRVQDSKPESDAAAVDAVHADTTPSSDSNAKAQDLHPRPAATPARLPKAENARQAAAVARRPWEAPSRYIPAPMPQARFAVPQSQPSRVPAGVPPANAAPLPSPNSGTSTPLPVVASERTPMIGAPTGVQNSPDTHPKVIAPTSTTARKAQPALNPNSGSEKKPETKVASVSLPGMVKGWVPPKMAPDSSAPKIQIVHRQPEPKADVPNCGGDVVIPCPTLKKRPTGGTPEGDRW
jgi:hypothetical protein